MRETSKFASYCKRTWPLHLLLLPAFLITLIYQYIPMLGAVIAFKDYKPWVGILDSPWIGLEHFKYLFTFPDSKQVIQNTLIIAFFKQILGVLVPVLFALLLNEVAKTAFKKTIQTLVYMPHFLSWVILGGIFVDVLAVQGGIVNRLLGLFGAEPIFFLGSNDWFRATVVLTDVWKEFGFAAIVFLSALAAVNPNLYEAAEMDGANRWRQTIYITIPAIMPIVVVVATLALGRIMNAGFDQIFNLYNPLVYETGDIIDTFVYRIGLEGGQFSFGTAVGLFKSAIGFVLIITCYRILYKVADYRIF
ncbi:ABC transporter permease subunit [Paenibacillus pasadenensis]|uniref:ABC transporter permease n=1 Tax=Paenibacillus pasadenensis TaxID=217090 RepID=UPI00203EB9D7|nr:ABC transporter permease subunit [Paenibacillus pasadenensis]MCM3746600.1 ABC transporter permease subunit [Paenibacillus pasadenensis]